MKKIISAILLFAVFTASAQRPGPPPSIEERLQKSKEILGKELQLNSSQMNVATEAFNQFFRQADLLFKDNPPAPNPNQQKQMQGFEKQRDQKIMATLSESQVKRYKEIILKMRPPKPGQGNQQGPPPPKQ